MLTTPTNVSSPTPNPNPNPTQVIKTKSTKDVIEFYYVWKMTSHYQQWKRGFEPLEPHPFHIAPSDA